MLDVALAAVDVTATAFVMNDGGRFHRRHLLAEARRHLALVLRGRCRDPGLDEGIVAAAISTHCLDISEPTPTIGPLSDYRLCTARWSLSGCRSGSGAGKGWCGRCSGDSCWSWAGAHGEDHPAVVDLEVR
ncbi:hypothetical protein ACWEWK_03090 [Streptomyces sp. NPDC003757]